jgi:hypothetical protein
VVARWEGEFVPNIAAADQMRALSAQS